MALTKEDISQIKNLIDTMDVSRIRTAVRVDIEEVLEENIGELAAMVQGQFAHIDTRFDKLEARIDRLEDRMDRLEARMSKIEIKVGHLEGRIASMESKILVIEAELEDIKEELKQISTRSKEDADYQGYEIIKLGRRVTQLEDEVGELKKAIK